jgi:hypothetical protein
VRQHVVAIAEALTDTQGHTIEADEDTRPNGVNANRQWVMSMQRQAVDMVDAELRRLGHPYDW